MPNNPIIGNVTIGSVTKSLTGGYVCIGGVWKPIVETYVNVGGVWKPAWQKIFTWKKYTTKDVLSYTADFSGTTESLKLTSAARYGFATSYTIDSSGNPVLAGTQTTLAVGSIQYYYTTYPYSIIDGVLYKFTGMGGPSVNYITYRVVKAVISSHVASKECGNYIEDVESDTENAYPINGIHTDGYWYVFQS